jgi:hypothetical protein
MFRADTFVRNLFLRRAYMNTHVYIIPQPRNSFHYLFWYVSELTQTNMIWGFHCSEDLDCGRLGNDIYIVHVYSGRWYQGFGGIYCHHREVKWWEQYVLPDTFTSIYQTIRFHNLWYNNKD